LRWRKSWRRTLDIEEKHNNQWNLLPLCKKQVRTATQTNSTKSLKRGHARSTAAHLRARRWIWKISSWWASLEKAVSARY
jgi:hypothetical protein